MTADAHHLDSIAGEQQRLAAEAASGRAATTVYGGSGHALRQTVIALTGGSRLAEHANPGEATVTVLRGRVRLATEDAGTEGSAGDLLVVPQATHSLEALEDAAILLTVVKHDQPGPADR